MDSQNVPGQSGLLATDFREGSVYLYQSDAYPGTYRAGLGFAPWITKPATYYLQIEATEEIPEGPLYIHFLSPVYTLVITPAPPAAPAPPPPARATPPPPLAPVIVPAPPESVAAALTRGQASSVARSLIRARTHRRAYHMRGECKLTGAQTARCFEKWYSAQHISAETTVSAGVFSIDATYEPVTISFIGVRAQVGCVSRFGAKHCSVKERWHR